MGQKKRDEKEVITLGSGDLMIKEYTGTMPKYTDFTDADLLGRIQGGATIEYTADWYEAKDDTGIAAKKIITSETATLSSGVVTWNGVTLEKLVATARVSDDGKIRTVKLGGIANNNNKSYALCFHHTDHEDGDVWVVVRAVNQGGVSFAFQKDQETVINAEFNCLPTDDSGTLIEYYEQIKEATSGGGGGATP